MHQFTNKLIGETSPYLLQHAHNPVNWYPWSDEALSLSKQENKPILVSIGYSACHWCHVMEKESFEDEETAKLMNDQFLNIKIDREERPDLDHIYMDAVQAMTGSGGWPLNVFLTPDLKPFYGGTYFPPKRAYNRPSWQEVLKSISQAFNERRSEIDAQAENLTEHLLQSNSFGTNTTSEQNIFISEKLEETFQSIMKMADKVWGGFGRAPKFPQSFVIKYLLRFFHVTKNKEALQQAQLCIDKMIDGGIYDQAGGGFARYATDTEWLVPHFEKMLYDNALLIAVISEAFQLTGNERYKEVIDETIEFVKRELMNNEAGFYAALDADSEGEEGKFYVWSHDEVKEILKGDAEVFCKFFNITPGGNWEGKSILWRKEKEEKFCIENEIPVTQLKDIIGRSKIKLLERRDHRVRPQTDDKFILSWNALMNIALSKAFAATGNIEYRKLALQNMDFILNSFSKEDPVVFFHSWKNNMAKQPAFLDDYASLVQALIQLQEITGEAKFLLKAKELTEYVLGNFSDDDTNFFCYTNKNQTDILLRKKEVYDGAQPSGNAMMADNLFRLSLYFDIPLWREKALGAISSLGNAITGHPVSFGVWACLLLEVTEGVNEIAVVDKNAQSIMDQIVSYYIPHKIILIGKEENSQFPLLAGKKSSVNGGIYLCRNYSCKSPVTTTAELMQLIEGK